MFKKQKLIWLLVCLITIFIFIGWFFNLKHFFSQENSEDSFMSILKKTVIEANKSFKDLGKNIKTLKDKTLFNPLTNQELLRLKEKVLQHNEEKKEITK